VHLINLTRLGERPEAKSMQKLKEFLQSEDLTGAGCEGTVGGVCG
jgi:hypothetical protein